MHEFQAVSPSILPASSITKGFSQILKIFYVSLPLIFIQNSFILF